MKKYLLSIIEYAKVLGLYYKKIIIMLLFYFILLTGANGLIIPHFKSYLKMDFREELYSPIATIIAAVITSIISIIVYVIEKQIDQNKSIPKIQMLTYKRYPITGIKKFSKRVDVTSFIINI